jgi:hypothetical protein
MFRATAVSTNNLADIIENHITERVASLFEAALVVVTAKLFDIDSPLYL